MADTNGGKISGEDDLLKNYRAIPEEDRKRAKVFFDRGKTVADTGNFEYAIEMYIQGLNVDPENVEAHQLLRDISLKRKASGGKDMGMMDRMKMPKAKDEKQTMLNAEKLLAYSPGDTGRMVSLFQAAFKAGCYDTVLWIGPIAQRTNADAKKPDYKTFIILRDIYSSVGEYKLATDACYLASTLRPDDMELQHEMKNLAAHLTMSQGKYGSAKSFRESMRDVAVQEKLMDADKDVHAEDAMVKAISEAEEAWKAAPEDWSKFSKYIDSLTRTEQLEHENRAIEELDAAYQKTSQFRYRQRQGVIRMAQLSRQDRSIRQDLQTSKNDPDYNERIQEYKEFLAERLRTELEEFKLVLEHYPTDTNARFQVASRMFQLGQHQDAIPVLQQVRSDPKHRTEASILLGQSFLAAGFPEEAADTLKAVIDEYQAKGDERSMKMYYWYARALEEKKDTPTALKAYSQVAQWNFNFGDVQARIKKLRAAASATS
ncbi:MAG TPA: tetratricopeptide repeat protein [Tepidisphaeraceae bacterium]|nr:tetratricopeptide repeat protein [Tepidisphaeraceae bacterium]